MLYVFVARVTHSDTPGRWMLRLLSETPLYYSIVTASVPPHFAQTEPI